jgi:tetratricopeptide (TPR) repeat protein
MESVINYLDLLKQKKYEEALHKANHDYLSNPIVFNLRNRADTFMCLKDYERALQDYLEVIRISEDQGDSDYLRTGVSYWILGRHFEAVEIWKSGLNTKYTDAAGGVEVPATLYFAAIFLEDSSLEKESLKRLKRRWKSKAAMNWPGAVAGYLLDEVTDEEFLNSVSSHPTLRIRHLCQAHFYLAVKKLKIKDIQGYVNNLNLSASSEMGYLEQEYYLAIGELDRIIG